MMTSRERVKAAFGHVQPDSTPCDFFTTPEIHRALYDHFTVSDDDDLLDRLGIDIRYVEPPYAGPELPAYDDGSVTDIWGIISKPMPNEYGDYAEPVNFPYAKWKTVEEAKRFQWPSPECYDYGATAALCDKYPGLAVATGGYGVQDFINGVAFGRGVEQVLLDIATEDPVYLFIVEKRHSFFMEQIERTLAAARGRIDFVLCGDDFGSQRSALISPGTFDRLFTPKKKEFFDMVHSHGAKVSHHSCGSTRALVPRFIDLGMDALQTIQPRAAASRTLRPSPLRRFAIFPAAVVLPLPWSPTRKMTVGGFDARASLTDAGPIDRTSSSCTILTTCCPGVMLPSTFSPAASFSTRLIRSLATR